MEVYDLPRADESERDAYIVRPYEEIPTTELVTGSISHLVSTDDLTISFLTMKRDSVFSIHTHENVQVMVILEGYCDEIIDGKLYRVKSGDMIYLPSNIPHGAIIRDTDCKIIDIFTPMRADYMKKYADQNKNARKYF